MVRGDGGGMIGKMARLKLCWLFVRGIMTGCLVMVGVEEGSSADPTFKFGVQAANASAGRYWELYFHDL